MVRCNLFARRWVTRICQTLLCAVLLVGAGGGCGSPTRPAADSQEPQAAEVTSRRTQDAPVVPHDTENAVQAPEVVVSDPVADAALREACTRGDLQAAQQAIGDGADVNVADENGRTPLMWAAYDGHEAIVATLLHHKARVNERDAEGRTALMYCASGAFPGTVRLLLLNGAEIDVRDKAEGFTALMFAAAEGQAEVVKVLLSHDADRTVVDVDGDNAAAFAQRAGHEHVVQLLAP
ncbi:MAG: ankyrin repeat domain-containing protein [Pirellulaceae bacterium]